MSLVQIDLYRLRSIHTLGVLLKQREKAFRHQHYNPPGSNYIARGNTEHVTTEDLEKLDNNEDCHTAPNQHSNDANIEQGNEEKDRERNSRRKRAKFAEDPNLQASHVRENNRAKAGIGDGAKGTCDPIRPLTKDSQGAGLSRAVKSRRELQMKTMPETAQPKRKPVRPHID